MSIYDDLLSQYMQAGLQGAAQGNAASQSKGNPMSDILKVIFNAGAGLATGGPAGAAMGAVRGLSDVSNPEISSIAKSGLGTYQSGMRENAFRNMVGSEKDPAKQSILSMAQFDPDASKAVTEAMAKSAYPTGADVFYKAYANQLSPQPNTMNQGQEIKQIITDLRSKGVSDSEILQALLK